MIGSMTDPKVSDRAQPELEPASRLAFIGELTGMVAHQISQPLGAILCHIDTAKILLEPGKPPPNLDRIRQLLSDIRANTLRAGETTKRIRALLHKGEMQNQFLDLGETVSEASRFVAEDALHRRIQIVGEHASGLPRVLGDRVLLQQVLVNLILNAMEAMSDTPDLLRQIIVQTKRHSDQSVECAVIDRGPGIPQDKMARLFQSFFTTKPNGMGLGLYIADSIVEAHRGRIWAENNSQGGATFHFTVRLAEHAAECYP